MNSWFTDITNGIGDAWNGIRRAGILLGERNREGLNHVNVTGNPFSYFTGFSQPTPYDDVPTDVLLAPDPRDKYRDQIDSYIDNYHKQQQNTQTAPVNNTSAVDPYVDTYKQDNAARTATQPAAPAPTYAYGSNSQVPVTTAPVTPAAPSTHISTPAPTIPTQASAPVTVPATPNPPSTIPNQQPVPNTQPQTQAEFLAALNARNAALALKDRKLRAYDTTKQRAGENQERAEMRQRLKQLMRLKQNQERIAKLRSGQLNRGSVSGGLQGDRMSRQRLQQDAANPAAALRRRELAAIQNQQRRVIEGRRTTRPVSERVASSKNLTRGGGMNVVGQGGLGRRRGWG